MLGVIERIGSSVDVAVVAAATALCWFACLSVDGGSVATPRLVACVLALGVVLVGAVLLRMHPRTIAATMTASFMLPWTVQAALLSDDGLYVLGAAVLWAGVCAATLGGSFFVYAVLPTTRLWLPRDRERRSPPRDVTLVARTCWQARASVSVS